MNGLIKLLFENNQTTSATFPVTMQEAVINSEGKDLSEVLGEKVNIIDIIDNLTSTDTDKPLSAKQGKILYDFGTGSGVFQRRGNSGITDANNITNNGEYLLDPSTVSNLPSSYTADCTLMHYATSANSTVVQICISSLTSSENIYFRKKKSGTWSEWYGLHTPIDNLTSTDTDKPLSANQGKVIYDYLSGGSVFQRRAASSVTVSSVLDIENNGYYLLDGDKIEDLPAAVYFHLLVIGNSSQKVLVATRLTYNHYVVYIRKKQSSGSSGWSDWKSITFA